MSKIRRFEDLIAWQKGRKLASTIHALTMQPKFRRDFKLRDQIWDAAISVPSNIAEGFERNRLNEFHQHRSVSKASCGEVRSDLYLAFDAGHIDERALAALLEQAREVSRIVSGLRSSIEREIHKQQILRTQDSGLRT
jgi:four helix bundle protein